MHRSNNVPFIESEKKTKQNREYNKYNYKKQVRRYQQIRQDYFFLKPAFFSMCYCCIHALEIKLTSPLPITPGTSASGGDRDYLTKNTINSFPPNSYTKKDSFETFFDYDYSNENFAC